MKLLTRECYLSVVQQTCSTIGSCSGGSRFSEPLLSQTLKAVNCSAKKGLLVKLAESPSLGFATSCCRHKSRARSQACLKNVGMLEIFQNLTFRIRFIVQEILEKSELKVLEKICHGCYYVQLWKQRRRPVTGDS